MQTRVSTVVQLSAESAFRFYELTLHVEGDVDDSHPDELSVSNVAITDVEGGSESLADWYSVLANLDLHELSSVEDALCDRWCHLDTQRQFSELVSHTRPLAEVIRG